MNTELINQLTELVGNQFVTQISDILRKYDITRKTSPSANSNNSLLNSFLSAKKVEGKSTKTLKYYKNTLSKLLTTIKKTLKQITTDDLRNYLSDFQNQNGSSNVTIDNIRRIFSSFFSWLEDEDFIVKSPVRRIHKVKTTKVVKETLSDEDLEKLRESATSHRDRAIVEFLSSTGVRVGEIVNLNIGQIKFDDRSAIVLGKGSTEREVYFDARTKIHLQRYLSTRTDTSNALFVSNKAPNNRLTIGTIELIVKKLGESSSVHHVHPHKFRRTLATRAIDKGMPVEQVQKLLGHVRIDTTMNYAMVNQANVKNSHRKYIS
ncbi:site-specific tyrosine recombinase/integron integrase [Weissella paramesenteroides]|uniref:site-specific tyrosine recombinase/integron integrase n=1 Tax=Weissella paramesenteroides TaxID=1249 RepID=UPI0011269B1F|nr:site-specific tyrosine recombinase/integron integrase [Weissella paramesenteroides]MBU7556407.1 tyrosine-type recombinase/integrase [Weissella paramesenteroides]TPF03344.1 integrase [Weissella paramesenteroides]